MPFHALSSLPMLSDAVTRSVSAENPTGEPGRGGMAVPDPADPDLPHSAAARDLGQGWKVRPFLKPRAGETVTLMDVQGSGIIQHIWMATEPDWTGNGRACVLRFYWDDEAEPSVEVPLTDFFAVGHDRFAPIDSAVVTVNPASSLNCYWPMPFRRRCRITFTNESPRDLTLLAYQVTYTHTQVPAEAGYFHAQWRRSVTRREQPQHTIVDNIRGRGRYVGTALAWTQLSEGWFGEGEIKFFMDGDAPFPTICGTGTEDYFGGSYGFPRNYSTLYLGAQRVTGKVGEGVQTDGPPRWSLYRWHVLDPVCFARDLRVTIQTLGWWPDKSGRYQPLEEDVASVAYWYQSEPHHTFPPLPAVDARWPR